MRAREAFPEPWDTFIVILESLSGRYATVRTNIGDDALHRVERIRQINVCVDIHIGRWRSCHTSP